MASAASSAAGGAQAHADTARITIQSRTPNAVQVEEQFAVAPSTLPLELRLLTRPCMLIENMVIARNGVTLSLVEVRNGPWITLRDTTASAGDSGRVTARYRVWLGGSRTVPLAYLTRQTARNVSTTRGMVRVAMRFPHDSGVVEFPRMTREARNEWSETFLASPSFVKVGGFAFPCDRVPPPGDDGGLLWRFRLLVLIMVAWVPLYLAWARRTSGAEAA